MSGKDGRAAPNSVIMIDGGSVKINGLGMATDRTQTYFVAEKGEDVHANPHYQRASAIYEALNSGILDGSKVVAPGS